VDGPHLRNPSTYANPLCVQKVAYPSLCHTFATAAFTMSSGAGTQAYEPPAFDAAVVVPSQGPVDVPLKGRDHHLSCILLSVHM
jgi:hypothetical protein